LFGSTTGLSRFLCIDDFADYAGIGIYPEEFPEFLSFAEDSIYSGLFSIFLDV
tara:strand:+ start:2467 stop:2625 length:159 start_codon:yes stop_codon:yes gene_type:complete